MIKVLKEGRASSAHFSCPTCGCEFAADSDEYSVGTMTKFTLKRGFHRVMVFEMECPRCDANVKVEKD